MSDKGGQYDILVTPNPAEFAFRVFRDRKLIRPENIPVNGQAFKTTDEAKRHNHLLSYYGDYVFTYPQDGPDGTWFYYAKDKTDKEKNTPFDTFYSARDYSWPAVLEDVYFVEATTFPQTVNTGSGTVATAPRYFPRFRFRPGVNHNSRIKVEQFLAPTPWPSSTFNHQEPVPTNIDAYFLGVSVNFERCLHEDVEFKELIPGASVVYGAGMKNPPASRDPFRQFFPATNFTEWANFVVSDAQQTSNGVWLREKVTIFPPAPPETIIR